MAFFIAFLFMIIAEIENRSLPTQMEMRVEMVSSVTGRAKVYYDIGDGLNEKHSKTFRITSKNTFQILRFPLPKFRVQNLRFDPIDGPGNFSIYGIYLYDNFNRLIKSIDLEAIAPLNQISYVHIKNNILMVETEPQATDPMLALRLKYPLSLSLLYPMSQRLKDNYPKMFGHNLKTFSIVFIIALVAMLFARTDLLRVQKE